MVSDRVARFWIQCLGFSQRFTTWTFARLSMVSESGEHIGYASEFGELPSGRACVFIGPCRILDVR